jgi:hypothetical protein
MKSSQAKKAVEKIAELTGAEISEDNLFLESIVMSNARLRLAISKVGDCVEMNRIPASYFWGHFTMLCSVIGICIFGFLEAQQSSTVENVKAIIWSVIIITSGYGFIAWVNRKAERENPVLSYDLKKKLLVAGPQRRRIKRDAGTGFDFAVIARNSKPHLPDYDDEITPFARGLKIPYLHVSRSIVGKDFDVNRIV